jgi:hypothetical protein
LAKRWVFFVCSTCEGLDLMRRCENPYDFAVESYPHAWIFRHLTKANFHSIMK